VRFSVLLPTRNRLEYLRLAIETVRRQDYQDWEIIVSDNDSAQDIAGYVAGLHDQRIRYLRIDRFVSVTENWNNALEASRGDYVVMLGDDDGLMPGYFTTMERLITTHGQPDLIYTGAYLYADPGVLPGYPDGLLDRLPLGFRSAPEPYWLEVEQARRVARQLFDFKRKIGLNSQFSLISRPTIDTLRARGAVFQSPFPDFYTTCVLFLTASRILIDPRPQVIIGMSPKSYGFFLFNHQEQGGVQHLNSLEIPDKLRSTVLPGTNSHTSWLLAMEAVWANYGSQLGLRVNYQRYRILQIEYCYAEYWHGRQSRRELAELRARLSVPERLVSAVAWSILAAIFKLTPPAIHRLIAWIMNRSDRVLRSSLDFIPGTSHGRYRDLLEVFEAFRSEAEAA
jgi:glycosyltransferase involved in cell wall biosynthesis